MTEKEERQATTDALDSAAQREEKAIQADEQEETAHFGGETETPVVDDMGAGEPEAPAAEMGSAPWEEPQPAEEYAAAEPASALEVAAEAGAAMNQPIDEAVVGSIAPAAEPASDIPAGVLPDFPHALDGSHALDSIGVGDVARKTTETGYSRSQPAHFSDGNLIAQGDALAHLPVGSTIEKNNGGQIVMTMPETETRGPFLTFGKNVHRCIAQAWPWLVGEGHAKVS